MMDTKTTHRNSQGLLGVYLNDHLAGATAGLELVRRMTASAESGTESAAVLKRLVTEIAADRSALIKFMTALEIKIRGYKMFAAWAGEKAARLKFNGRLLTRSPLSNLEETEILRLDAGQLDELLARATGQSDTLESLRVHIAEQVLTDDAR
jgi:hypothetical protein